MDVDDRPVRGTAYLKFHVIGLTCFHKRLHGLIEKGKATGELSAALDVEAAATLFIGTIQGLVMQALLAGDVGHMLGDAPRVFAIYRRGIGRSQ